MLSIIQKIKTLFYLFISYGFCPVATIHNATVQPLGLQLIQRKKSNIIEEADDATYIYHT
jgi:hypothetical protein